jgi:hypothetical protein
MRPAIGVHDGVLEVGGLRLADLARRFGTPLYVYSEAAIQSALDAYESALAGRDHLVCYAVKANPSLALLQLVARRGDGFDIVSAGELERVLAAGGEPARIVFSGVGKTGNELERALRAGIGCFNVESESELARLSDIATRLGREAAVSLRVNPDVDAHTHPYISTGLSANKFGIPHARARDAFRRAADLRPCGSPASTATSALRSPRPLRSSTPPTACSTSSRPSSAMASPSTTWTSAAAWAFATATRSRPGLRPCSHPCWHASTRAATVTAASSSSPAAPWSAKPACSPAR